jgi:hypothetical protein
MSKEYEAPDSDFYSAPEHRLCGSQTDFSPQEIAGMKFVEQPPTWQGTPTGRKQRTMEDFIKENFPNGMYIPGYMLHKRG